MAQTSAGQPPQTAPYQGLSSPPSKALSGVSRGPVFGEVMGLMALTLGSLALGAYIWRDMSGGLGILFFVAGFGCIIGLNVASARGHEQLAITLLLGLGLLLGLTLGPVLLVCEGRSVSGLAGGGSHRRVVAGLGAFPCWEQWARRRSTAALDEMRQSSRTRRRLPLSMQSDSS